MGLWGSLLGQCMGLVLSNSSYRRRKKKEEEEEGRDTMLAPCAPKQIGKDQDAQADGDDLT